MRPEFADNYEWAKRAVASGHFLVEEEGVHDVVHALRGGPFGVYTKPSLNLLRLVLADEIGRLRAGDAGSPGVYFLSVA